MKMKIGRKSQKIAGGKGLTQEQLADVLGVSAQAVSRWENSGAYPDITLCQALPSLRHHGGRHSGHG